MKALLLAGVVAAAAFVCDGRSASAQYVTYYAAAPVAAYYAPAPVYYYGPAYYAPAPVVAYYGPAAVTYVGPRRVYYGPAPVMVRTKVYVRGQPFRNFARAVGP